MAFAKGERIFGPRHPSLSARNNRDPHLLGEFATLDLAAHEMNGLGGGPMKVIPDFCRVWRTQRFQRETIPRWMASAPIRLAAQQSVGRREILHRPWTDDVASSAFFT